MFRGRHANHHHQSHQTIQQSSTQVRWNKTCCLIILDSTSHSIIPRPGGRTRGERRPALSGGSASTAKRYIRPILEALSTTQSTDAALNDLPLGKKDWSWLLDISQVSVYDRSPGLAGEKVDGVVRSFEIPQVPLAEERRSNLQFVCLILYLSIHYFHTLLLCG